MNPPVEKFSSVERELAKANGEFELFGLFLHEDAGLEVWDLVVSASWLDPDARGSLELVVDAVKKRLDEKELMSLSRVVILPPENTFVEDVLCRWNKEHEVEGIGYPFNAGGVPIERAFLITSRKRTATAKAAASKA